MRTGTRFAFLFTAAALAMPMSMPVWAVEKQDAKQETEAEDNGVELKMDDLPAAVQKTLKREAGDGKIEEVEKETKKGKTVYEADVIIDGDKYEIQIAENGKLISKKLDEEDDDDDKNEEHGKDDKDAK